MIGNNTDWNHSSFLPERPTTYRTMTKNLHMKCDNDQQHGPPCSAQPRWNCSFLQVMCRGVSAYARTGRRRRKTGTGWICRIKGILECVIGIAASTAIRSELRFLMNIATATSTAYANIICKFWQWRSILRDFDAETGRHWCPLQTRLKPTPHTQTPCEKALQEDREKEIRECLPMKWM